VKSAWQVPQLSILLAVTLVYFASNAVRIEVNPSACLVFEPDISVKPATSVRTTASPINSLFFNSSPS
jgi:hypothetical protein